MKINPKKTKIMSFNKSWKFDYPPEVYFSNKVNLEVITETKLVGVIISDDLRWQKNTDYICQKARGKLWTLRRMKKMNLGQSHIFDVFTKEVRSLLELAVPVWHSGLTKLQAAQIERVQKTALRIILGDDYVSYNVACLLLDVETLESRRELLCLNFARKEFKKEENSLFIKAKNRLDLRTKPKKVQEYNCRTRRFRNSSIPYLSQLLNNSK